MNNIFNKMHGYGIAMSLKDMLEKIEAYFGLAMFVLAGIADATLISTAAKAARAGTAPNGPLSGMVQVNVLIKNLIGMEGLITLIWAIWAITLGIFFIISLVDMKDINGAIRQVLIALGTLVIQTFAVYEYGTAGSGISWVMVVIALAATIRPITRTVKSWATSRTWQNVLRIAIIVVCLVLFFSSWYIPVGEYKVKLIIWVSALFKVGFFVLGKI